ncbi:MAG: SpoIID/LytB domain-containing protein [Cyanobacteriota bacterium]|nr:SpoIID/LytB domain-containing protein [Cyanobacteriota bacterium]
MARPAGWPVLLLAALPLVALPLAGGARLGSAMVADAPKGLPIRVLLLEAPQITIGAAGKQGLQLRDQSGRTLLVVSPGRQLRVGRKRDVLTLEPYPEARKEDNNAAQPPLALGSPLGVEEVPPGSEPRQVPLQELRFDPIAPQSLVVLKQRRYRGTLLLRPEGEGLQAVNRLPLETYLAGVVGSEMPGSWPLAALEAQAVASRTYALQQLRPKAPFDLKATVASQVYKGVEAESGPVRQAVASTRGKVLMHGQQLINAVFHSSSGGLTENSGDLWSRQLPYLVSVPDFDTSSPVSRWEKAFAPDALRQAFAEIGGATTIQPLQASKTGRIQRAKVIGPRGELVLSGSELRRRLGLRSTLVQFQFEPAKPQDMAGAMALPTLPYLPQPTGEPGDAREGPAGSMSPGGALLPPDPISGAPSFRLVVRGRGYGHGVGMSQWGAYALALRGKSYEDILRHYYRGAVLRSY